MSADASKSVYRAPPAPPKPHSFQYFPSPWSALAKLASVLLVAGALVNAWRIARGATTTRFFCSRPKPNLVSCRLERSASLFAEPTVTTLPEMRHISRSGGVVYFDNDEPAAPSSDPRIMSGSAFKFFGVPDNDAELSELVDAAIRFEAGASPTLDVTSGGPWSAVFYISLTLLSAIGILYFLRPPRVVISIDPRRAVLGLGWGARGRTRLEVPFQLVRGLDVVRSDFNRSRVVLLLADGRSVPLYSKDTPGPQHEQLVQRVTPVLREVLDAPAVSPAAGPT